MVLLDMLVRHDTVVGTTLPADYRLVAAHVNHGIRSASAHDEQLVQEQAKAYGLEFESTQLNLASDASEQEARDRRYLFFEQLMSKHRASAIITAHHSDDLIETAIINMIRGTGRSGLSSLRSTSTRIRPLLCLTKEEIYSYANSHRIKWNEDETNSTDVYLRNRIRAMIAAKAGLSWKNSFLAQIEKIASTNEKIDKEINTVLQYRYRRAYVLSRSWVTMLPHSIATEFVRAVLVRASSAEVDRDLVERLTVAIKVAKVGTKVDIDKSTLAMLTKRSLRFVDRVTLKTRTL